MIDMFDMVFGLPGMAAEQREIIDVDYIDVTDSETDEDIDDAEDGRDMERHPRLRGLVPSQQYGEGERTAKKGE